MLETKSISRIVRVMGYGMSCPIHIIADDGKDYILKTKIAQLDDDDNIQISAKELFTEIFSYLYLHTLGALHIPKVCLLEVTDETLRLAQKFANGDDRQKQALQNLKHSKGLNLGVAYIENANKSFVVNDFAKVFIKRTINYDARLMNTDRDFGNPNILEDLSGEKWLIDFGMAFDTLALLDNLTDKTLLVKDEPNENYFNKCCFGTYIFSEAIRSDTARIKKALPAETISNITHYVCNIIDLLDDNSKQCLAQIITKRQSSKRIFCA